MADTATYDLIASQTLASAASSITFSSIPASWTDLRLILVGTFSTGVPGYPPSLQFNGDTATNYSYTLVNGSGASASSLSQPSYYWIYCGQNTGWSTTLPSMASMDIFSYAGSTNKTSLIASSNDLNGSGNSERVVGLWCSTAAITSIKLSINNNASYSYAIGTTATLYGIKSA